MRRILWFRGHLTWPEVENTGITALKAYAWLLEYQRQQAEDASSNGKLVCEVQVIVLSRWQQIGATGVCSELIASIR